MRAIVKVRLVAGSAVVSLPMSILRQAGIELGDRVSVEPAPVSGVLTVTKEK